MTPQAAPLPGMVGEHPAMLEVYALTREAAVSDLPVVVVGDTGTGKELVARALHALSPVATGPFIAVNCAAILESLAEAELFGWERGAFTGAHARTPGLIEAAHGGTLFLDEACSLSTGMQAKLLRALECGDVRRLGSREVTPVSFRLALATAAAPSVLERQGRWRPDFAHRVVGYEVVLPPLRDRRTDVPVLGQYFLNLRNGHPPRRLTIDAIETLTAYDWPGNVRQLKMVMSRLAGPKYGSEVDSRAVWTLLPAATKDALDQLDLRRLVDEGGGSVRATAKMLGVPETTLRRRLHGRLP